MPLLFEVQEPGFRVFLLKSGGGISQWVALTHILKRKNMVGW